MKHFLPSTALALMMGLGSLTLGGNAAAANKWDSLQPDRDEIVASLNVGPAGRCRRSCSHCEVQALP